MEFLRTETFKRDYKVLPDKVKLAVNKSILLMESNWHHPSLQLKKMEGTKGKIWEARVTLHHRLTFEVDGSVIRLRRVGTHDVLRSP